MGIVKGKARGENMYSYKIDILLNGKHKRIDFKSDVFHHDLSIGGIINNITIDALPKNEKTEEFEGFNNRDLQEAIDRVHRHIEMINDKGVTMPEVVKTHLERLYGLQEARAARG